jgi:hypothetical protein
MAQLAEIKNAHGTYLIHETSPRDTVFKDGLYRFIRASENIPVTYHRYYEAEFLNGVKHGIERMYTDAGMLTNENIYEKGILHGASREFYNGGQTSISNLIEYSKGKKHGKNITYSQNTLTSTKDNIIIQESEYLQGDVLWRKSYNDFGGLLISNRYFDGLLTINETYNGDKLVMSTKYLKYHTHGKCVNGSSIKYFINGSVCTQKEFLKYNRDCADVIKRCLDRDTADIICGYLDLDFYKR